jgi:hypothetical protein
MPLACTSVALAPTFKKKGREILTPLFHSKVCKPYGVGIRTWAWFELALSFPDPSTAVVT